MRRNLLAYTVALLATAGIVTGTLAVIDEPGTIGAAVSHGPFPQPATDHGADPAPPGVDVTKPVPISAMLAKTGLDDAPRAAADTVPVGTPSTALLTRHVDRACYGTGSDGNRVQVLYAREADQADRYSQALPVIQHEVATIDDVFALTARKTGGGKRVRWVTDTNCAPVVGNVVLPDGALGASFGATIDALDAAGYNASNRKYLVFSEGTSLCGIASYYQDTSMSSANWNNGRAPLYSRIDQGCWVSYQHSTAAHELMHNLGAVQSNAPHPSGNGHCNDDYDTMCYADGGATSKMAVVCPDRNEEFLFDCRNDDYFHTRPASGYLTANWNTADSSFLENAPTLPASPAVTITASTASPVAGKAFTLTATASGASTYAWSGPYLPAVKTGRTVTVTVPATASGTFTWTVKVDTTSGVAGAGAKQVTVVKPVTRTTPKGTVAASGTWPRTVTGTFKRADGKPLTGAPVTVQVYWSGSGRWATAKTGLKTNSYGKVAYPTYPTRDGAYRFVFPGNTSYTPATSSHIWVKIPAKVGMSVKRGRPNTVYGSFRTYKGTGVSAYLTLQQRRAGTSTWYTVKTVYAKGGAVAYKVQPKRGTYYRWVFKGTTAFSAATSAQGHVTY